MELAASTQVSTPAKVSQQQCPSTQKEKDSTAELCSKMDTLMSRLTSLENQMSRRNQQDADMTILIETILFQETYQPQDMITNYDQNRYSNQRSRGRGGNRYWQQDRRNNRGNYLQNNTNNPSNYSQQTAKRSNSLVAGQPKEVVKEKKP